MSESPPPEVERVDPSEIELTPEIIEAVAQRVVQGLSFEYSRNAPLPTHEEMAGYKQVDPGLVEVIKQIALDGSAYPESRDRKLSDRARDLIRSFTILGVGALFLAGYLAHLGYDVAALIAGVAPLGAGLLTTVLSFVRRWWLQRQRRQSE